MSKKKVITFLLFLLFFIKINASEREIWKLFTGLGAVALGSYLSVDGFSINDISNPSLEIQNYSFSSDYTGGNWLAEIDGNVKNTGNTTLKCVKINYEFFDTYGTAIVNGNTYIDIRYS